MSIGVLGEACSVECFDEESRVPGLDAVCAVHEHAFVLYPEEFGERLEMFTEGV